MYLCRVDFLKWTWILHLESDCQIALWEASVHSSMMSDTLYTIINMGTVFGKKLYLLIYISSNFSETEHFFHV